MHDVDVERTDRRPGAFAVLAVSAMLLMVAAACAAPADDAAAPTATDSAESEGAAGDATEGGTVPATDAATSETADAESAPADVAAQDGASEVAAAGGTYPTEPITIVIPYGQGGGWDSFNNHALPFIQAEVPVPIRIVHMPGAGATVGHAFVADQEADGYTLIAGDPGSSIIAPLTQDVGYDTETFDPIARLGVFGLAFIVAPESPLQTLDDLIQEAQARPGEVVYGATGPVTTDRIAMLLLQDEAEFELRTVPYSGTGEVLFATIGQEVEVGSVTTGAAFDANRDSGVRVLATSLPDPSISAGAAQFPSVVDFGYEDSTLVGYRALMAPTGVPQEVTEFWAGVMERLSEIPELSMAVEEGGEVWAPLGPPEFGEFFQQTTEDVQPVIEDIDL